MLVRRQESYRDGKAGSHSVEVVWVLAHGHDLGNDGFICPVNAKYFRELLEILRGCFSDGKDCVTKPAHAQGTELLVEEFNAKLTCKERDVFDDGKSNPPLLVLGELYYRREQ